MLYDFHVLLGIVHPKRKKVEAKQGDAHIFIPVLDAGIPVWSD